MSNISRCALSLRRAGGVMLCRGKPPCRPSLNQTHPFQGGLIRLFLVTFAIMWSRTLFVRTDPIKSLEARLSIFYG